MGPLQILQINAQGLSPRLPLIGDLLTRLSVDVLLVQETLLNKASRATIVGYTQYRTAKTAGTRGLAIYVKRTLQHEIVTLPPTPSLEALGIRIHLTNSSLLIVNTYNSPSHQGINMAEVRTLLRSAPRVLLAGDLNALHPAWNRGRRNTAGSQLYNASQLQDFTILTPSAPTRTDPRTGATSTLDIALLRDVPFLVTARTLNGIDSDHNPVLLTAHDNPRNNPSTSRFDYAKADWTQFAEIVNGGLTIRRFNTTEQIDEGVRHLTGVIQTAMAAAIPKTRINSCPDTLPPDLQKLKQRKNAAKRRWVKYRRPHDRTAFNYSKFILQTELRAWRDKKWDVAMQNTTHTDIWKISGALKRQPHTIPPLNTPTGVAQSAAEKAEALSRHFEQVHKQTEHMTNPSLALRVEQTLASFFDLPPGETTTPTNPAEIKQIIKQRHPRKAPGPDNISNTVLKRLPLKALAFLAVLFNACLALAHFPTPWKTANILAFPKPGKDPACPQNYRPISLLSSLSKILERIIHTRLYKDLEPLLNSHQFGFRRGHSTTQQVLRLVEYVTEGYNLGHHTGAVFLDATAAFDTVWTRGLLYKMARTGFPRGLVAILQSYLTSRHFYVTVDGHPSPHREVANGTPQGSILGLVLFLIYVNDIPRFGRPSLAQYADDTSIYFRARSIPVLKRQLQRALDPLIAYFHKWRIQINALKTEAVLFTHRYAKRAHEHQLRIGPAAIPWTDHTKFLGVTLDRRLTFQRHVDTIQRKARAALAVLYPLLNRTSKLSRSLKVRLATSYIRPILTYAAPAWSGRVSDTNLYKLQVIQNKYLRTALNKPYYTRTRDLHRDAKVPHIGDVIVAATDKFYQKTSHSTNPLITALGDYSPESLPYRIRHKTPKHRLFQRDA